MAVGRRNLICFHAQDDLADTIANLAIIFAKPAITAARLSIAFVKLSLVAEDLAIVFARLAKASAGSAIVAAKSAIASARDEMSKKLPGGQSFLYDKGEFHCGKTKNIRSF
jgi:hypothetical protein